MSDYEEDIEIALDPNDKGRNINLTKKIIDFFWFITCFFKPIIALKNWLGKKIFQKNLIAIFSFISTIITLIIFCVYSSVDYFSKAAFCSIILIPNLMYINYVNIEGSRFPWVFYIVQGLITITKLLYLFYSYLSIFYEWGR